MSRYPLEGSERNIPPGVRVLGQADPDERLEVSLILRTTDRRSLEERVARLAKGERLAPLSRDEFAHLHGAGEPDLSAVREFARSQGLAVVQESAARRTVVVAGTVAQMTAAFGIQLLRCEHAMGTYRGQRGTIQLPLQLHGVIVAVLGLDNRPQARPHFRIQSGRRKRKSRAANPPAASFTPVQLASLYDFPAGDGEGQCVGIIELGGGYRPQDLQTYFASLSLPTPDVTAVSVDHAANQPTGDPSGPDGEVVLDIEVSGAIAPAAAIAVYFSPNTDAGFLDAVTTAAHDSVNNPSVISISWGAAETDWTAQAMRAMDEAFQAAIAMGITVCVAAGDSGSTDGVGDGANHVDFPASSPHALACGGTSLRATPTTILSEVVWNDGTPAAGATGGGVSAFFTLPPWQGGLDVTNEQGERSPLANRGVPDVAADADPDTGYQVVVDGISAVFGGTSAVAPLWAGLLARVNALTAGRAGHVQPLLYPQESAFRDITRGNNGGYRASAGWDACTGLGSPNGRKIAAIQGL